MQALLDSYSFAPAPHGLPPALDTPGPPAAAVAAALPPAAGIERAASPPATQHDDESMASVVDARNAYGSTALHRAAFNGRDGVVLALLRGGAGVSVVGRSGR